MEIGIIVTLGARGQRCYGKGMPPFRAATDVKPDVTAFYDAATFSLQYVVADPAARRCAIIDPVLDFDAKSGGTSTASADRMLQYITTEGLTPDWILDTHPHADHLSAAGYLKDVTGAQTATGAHVVEVQKIWKALYNLPDGFPTDGSQWDRLLADGETFPIGGMAASALHSPGHTLCSVSVLVGDAAFVHDTLFMPDSGTARTDFPGGDAARLWHSIQRILSLPDATRLFTGHDYRPGGRLVAWESNIAAQKAGNAHVRDYDEAGFVAMRRARDATLPMPKLILSALLVNIAGGRLPEPEGNGRRYLKIPLDAFPGAPWEPAS